jgi:hypothetical protein
MAWNRVNRSEPQLKESTIDRPDLVNLKAPVALFAASLADHLQARNTQIAGLIVAGFALRVPIFRISRLRFVGDEAADSHLMPEVPAKLNGTAA